MATKGPNGYPRSSYGWKDVTLRIHGTDEQIVLPVMSASRVWDVKVFLAQMVGIDNPSQLEFSLKNRKHRNTDEVGSNVTVRGIRTFQKQLQAYAHPFCVVGCGHSGLRMCMHLARRKIDFLAFERKHKVGGNCWVTIANPTSKLQSESCQYQLQWDPYDGGVEALRLDDSWGYWPSRDKILEHFHQVATEYGVMPHVRLQTELVDMKMEKAFRDPFEAYAMSWKSLKESDDSQGTDRCSAVFYYPGCLVVPHRRTWPGEDVFEGQMGYGFSCEFDYGKVSGERGLIIGMGAFAHENVRTYCEFGGDKVYIIARHFNLMLPRAICWWMNQAITPPTAAMCLDAFKPMYSLLQWDPWSFFSVRGNADRTVANIKQGTRWGISDVFFLAIYYDKAEVINSEVKRFKKSSAFLTNGNEVQDIQHVMKVIGFDGDFTVDRILKTQYHMGCWANGDWRLWVMSDTSSIDASRFNGVNLSPGAASWAHQSLHYVQNPRDAQRLKEQGLMPIGKAQPEFGSPAYHWSPREVVQIWVILGQFTQQAIDFEVLNNELKKQSMHQLAPPAKFIAAVKEDWDMYCEMFADSRPEIAKPEYPYTTPYLEELVMQEKNLKELEDRRAAARSGQAALATPAGEIVLDGFGDSEVAVVNAQPEQGIQQLTPTTSLIEPRSPISFAPAKAVLEARMRAQSPKERKLECIDWLAEGRKVRDHILLEAARVQSGKA